MGGGRRCAALPILGSIRNQDATRESGATMVEREMRLMNEARRARAHGQRQKSKTDMARCKVRARRLRPCRPLRADQRSPWSEPGQRSVSLCETWSRHRSAGTLQEGNLSLGLPGRHEGPDVSVGKAKKAVSDYKKAIGLPQGVAELSVFYCETALDLLSSCGMEDEGYFAALVRMFEQALTAVDRLPASERASFYGRLDPLRSRGR